MPWDGVCGWATQRGIGHAPTTVMTLDLTDEEQAALVQLLRRTGAYRNNSGQQTSPAAKIIVNVQKSFFFIGPLRPFIPAEPVQV